METAFLPHSPVELGSLISASKQTILLAFVERVRAEVPGASGETRPYLEDHIPALVDELSAYLVAEGSRADLVESERLAQVHGLQRARGEHYTLEDLRHEYRILRAIVFSLVPDEHGLSTRAALLFGDAFDRCVSRSTETFVRTSASELSAHRELLSAHVALRESEAALKFTLASAKLGTWSIDFTAVPTLKLSEEAAAMFGLRPDADNVGTAIDELLHPADRERATSVLRAAAESGTPYADEYRVVLRDGEVRWMDSRGRAQVDASGATQMMSGVVLDITERKRSEEQLTSSTRMLQLAASGGRVGFWHVDTAARTFDIDETMASQWGIDLATFPRTGEAGMAVVHPDDRATVRAAMASALATHTPYSAEYRVVHRSGVERWVHAQGEYHEDDHGALTLLSGISIDVTDRKLAQLAEQQSAAAAARERRTLEEVLEQTAVPTALLSGAEHVFTFANTAYRRTFSVDASIIGRTVGDVLPDAVAQGFGTLLDNVFSTGVPFSGREALFERQAPDGTTTRIYVDFTYAAKRGVDGEIEGVLATIVDVTDRVLLRKEIETANELLRAEKLALDQIFHSSPAGMAIWRGEDLVFERVNPEFAKFYGGRPLLGRPLLEAAPELEGQGFDELLRRVIATGEPVHGTEVAAKIVRVAGELPSDRYFDFAYIPLSDEHGQRWGVHDFALDVTERVLANRARDESAAKLRNAEGRLQRAIQVSKIGFYDWDFTTNHVTFNAQMQQDWGIEAGTTLEEIMRYIHADDRTRVSAAITKTLDEGAPYFEQYRVLRPTDGRTVWIEAQGGVVTDEITRDRRWLGTSLDITQRKANEETLQAAMLEAKDANVAKSAFLANMSHEIRTPLGSIMGFAELLRNPELNASETYNFISVIERNSQHLLRIVDDILDLSKVEAGKMLFERIEFSLPDLISDFTSLMSYRAREKAIEFSLRYDSAVPDVVLSDPTRLRQILNNVVGNAIKFTDHGRVELSVRFDRTKLTFAVQDTGRGLARDQAARLFQAFVQADESTTRQFGGTGLGLVLTRRLANAMGGDFVLEHSELGVGSTFTASIAVEVPAHATIAQPKSRDAADESPRPSDKRRLAGARVLVVDDSPDNRTFLSTVLRKAGAVAECAVDGAEGVAMALSKPYDAVLMDIQMPRLDGYQALERLKAQRYAAPVVALTAHAMVEERARAESKGFTAFLTKPIRSDALLEVLEDVKRGSEAARNSSNVDPAKRLALLVEDDEDSRMLLGSIIGKRGFDVTDAGDGAQALAALATGRAPDLVLLDLSLPDMSGGDVIDAIRRDERLAATKVVVVSGWDNLAQRAKELGADEALPKPIELASLRRILAALFGGNET